jgi:hypothetical protein
VDAVLTEDSDMLPYGVPRVLLKLDPREGRVQVITLARLPAATEVGFKDFGEGGGEGDGEVGGAWIRPAHGSLRSCVVGQLRCGVIAQLNACA